MKKLFRILMEVFKFIYHTVVKPSVRRPIPCGHGKNPHYRLDPATDTVIQDGEDDIQSMIDACEPSVNVNNVLKRYSQTGDPSLVRQRSEMFGDFSVMPGSFEESILTINKMRANFDNLTPEIKNKYGITDFGSFLTACNLEINKAQSVNNSNVSNPVKKEEGTNA